ncbi:MAG: DUF6873 family GME fold protein [Candidatus Omnitrophota bacterium]
MFTVYDKRMPEEYVRSLKKALPSSEFLPFFRKEPEVYGTISSHPDIYFFQLDGETAVHAPSIDAGFLGKMKDLGVHLIAGKKDPSGVYPHTALYNAVRVGKKVFLNGEHIDRTVLENVRKKNFDVLNVSQGYTRCSALAVSDNAFVTSDRKIAEMGRKNGMQVLEILPGHVKLPGEKYGFIGGAGGLTPEGDVVLAGDPRLHPEGAEILNFIKTHSRKNVYVEALPLYDAGGLFFFGRDPIYHRG